MKQNRLKKLKLFFIFTFLFLISCASLQKEEEGTFYNSLEKYYDSYSQYKWQNFDWELSKIFRDKAVKIRQGFALKPEEVGVGDKTKEIFTNSIVHTELKSMHEQMMLILSNSSYKQQYPDETAMMQFYYDCWFIEERYSKRYGEIAKCKQGFIDTISFLDLRLFSSNLEQQESIRKNIDNEKEEEYVFIRPKKYIVYFDFDSSAIKDEGSEEIWRFLKDVKNLKTDYRIELVGHGDRVGTKEYNEMISKRRADTIRHYLVRNGVPANKIEVKYQGNINPAIITNRDSKEEYNRRVDINLKML